MFQVEILDLILVGREKERLFYEPNYVSYLGSVNIQNVEFRLP